MGDPVRGALWAGSPTRPLSHKALVTNAKWLTGVAPVEIVANVVTTAVNATGLVGEEAQQEALADIENAGEKAYNAVAPFIPNSEANLKTGAAILETVDNALGNNGDEAMYDAHGKLLVFAGEVAATVAVTKGIGAIAEAGVVEGGATRAIATTTERGVIHVTEGGVALPPGTKIPAGLVDDPFRAGSLESLIPKDNSYRNCGLIPAPRPARKGRTNPIST